MTSQLKTGLLLGLLTAIILFFGQTLGGQSGLILAFGLAVIMNVSSYWFSDKIVLSMYRATEVPPDQGHRLYAIVSDLARRAQLPMPKVYIIPEQAPNAFATGRNPAHAVVAVTQGLLQLMNENEIRGVLAHEMGHIKNRDILIQSVAATLGGAIMMIANIVKWGAIFGMGRSDDEGGNPFAALALAIIAPLAAMLIQMGISRSREFLADQTGARLAGNPHFLANALEKLSAYSQRVPMRQGNPSSAHLFIVNPFSAQSIAGLFSTHPPTEERIRRLRNMTTFT